MFVAVSVVLQSLQWERRCPRALSCTDTDLPSSPALQCKHCGCAQCVWAVWCVPAGAGVRCVWQQQGAGSGPRGRDLPADLFFPQGGGAWQL